MKQPENLRYPESNGSGSYIGQECAPALRASERFDCQQYYLFELVNGSKAAVLPCLGAPTSSQKLFVASELGWTQHITFRHVYLIVLHLALEEYGLRLPV